MAINDSKMPYLLAAGAIGGAVGFLFLTKSGQRLRESVFNMEAGSTIPDKIEDARLFVEKRGREVGNRLKQVVDRVKDSFDEGKRVYEQGSVDFQRRMTVLDRNGADVVSNVHRAIDDFNKTIHEIESSLLEPMYQAGAIVKAVDGGVRRLTRRERRRIFGDTAREEDTAFYPGQQRVMG